MATAPNTVVGHGQVEDQAPAAARRVLEVAANGTREEPGTLMMMMPFICSFRNKNDTGWRPVFPGSSRLGIEPKTPGWLVQDPTTSRVCLLLQDLL